MSDRDGDDNGFPEFVRANYVPLVRYAASLAGSGQAEDLVQLTLVRLLRAWERVDPERRMAYARTVMVRLAWRRARRRWSGEIPMSAVPEVTGGGEELLAVDNDDALDRALRSLPLAQRVVLTLRYLDGLSEEETARQLGCPLGTVKSRAARGIDALRRSGLLSEESEETTQA